MKSLMNKFGRSLAALLAFAMVVTGVPNVGPFKAVEAKAAGAVHTLKSVDGKDPITDSYFTFTPGSVKDLTYTYGGETLKGVGYMNGDIDIAFTAANKCSVVAYLGECESSAKLSGGYAKVAIDGTNTENGELIAGTGGAKDALYKITASLDAGEHHIKRNTNSRTGQLFFLEVTEEGGSSSTPAEKYTVSFNSLGGSEVASITDVEKDAKITAPTAPTKDGYDFVGWCKEAACTNAWNFASDTVTADTTLYAKWTAKELPPSGPAVEYTVSFNSLGGSAVADATVSANSVVPKPADPTKAEFKFAGWYKEEACTNAWDFATDKVKGDTTLFAKWTAVDTKAIVPAIFEGMEAGTVYGSDQALQFKARSVFTKKAAGTGTLNESLGGGTVETPAGIQTTNKDVLVVYATADAKLSLSLFAFSASGSGKTLYFCDLGESAIDNDTDLPEAGKVPGTYASSDTVNANEAFSKDFELKAGHKYCFTLGGGGNLMISELSYVVTGTPAVTFTVSFNMLGHGDAIASKKVVSGAKVTEPTPAPEAIGWLFKGWFKEEACTTEFVFANETITANTTIYAKWEKESEDAEYTVTFNSNGKGTAPASVKAKTGTSITAPTVAPVEGYVVDGWYKEATCVTEWNFDTDVVTKDITLYAKWKSNDDPSSFRVVDLTKYIVSDTVANLVAGTELGDSNLSIKPYTDYTTYVKAENYIQDTHKGGMVITAQKDGKVVFTVHNVGKEVHVCDESSVTRATDKEGKLIDNATGKQRVADETIPSKPYDVIVEIKAGETKIFSLGSSSNMMLSGVKYKYSGMGEITTYDVTVNTATNGTVSVDKTKAAAGEVVTVTTTPATGYVLDTLTVMNGTSPVTVTGSKFTMPAGNVTVTATFKAQGATEYTVTVAPATNGTVTANKSKAVAGDIVTLTVAPAAGYVLDKLTVMNGTSPVTVTKNQFTMPAGNVTVTATFKAQGAPTPAPIPEGIDTEEETSEDGDYVFTYEAEKDFTGAAIKPFVAVEYNGVTLVPGVDYSVAYKNNKNVYTAKQDDKDFDAKKAPQITITGKGNYVGKDAVLYFTINEVKVEKEGDIVAKPFIAYNSKDASGDEVDPVATKKGIAFTGDAIDPIEAGLISLKTKAKVANVATELSLEPGVDYVYSIANNINVGTANIYVKCMGKYKGEAKLTFKIAKADLSQLVDAENRVIGKFTFKAKGNKPVVEIGDLLVGSDYKLAYKNNVKVNTPVKDINEVIKKYLAGDKDAKKALSTMPTVTATGTGNYTGKLEFFFDIDKADINSDLDVYMTAVKSGAAISSAVPSVFDADGNMLKAKTDFVVDYYVSVNNGEAQLIGAQGVNTGIKDAKGKDIVVKVGTKLNTLDPEVFTVTAVVKANTPKTGNATVDGEYPSIELVNATEKATLKSALTDKKFAAIYTGEAIELEAKDLTTTITVGRDKPVTLTLGTDYKVVYSNNVNKGTATAYIIPSTDGVTSGEKTIISSGVVKVTFKINPNTIAKPEYK